MIIMFIDALVFALNGFKGGRGRSGATIGVKGGGVMYPLICQMLVFLLY